MSDYTDAVGHAKRDRLALVKILRAQGLTFQEMGARLGVSRQRAHQLYREALKR